MLASVSVIISVLAGAIPGWALAVGVTQVVVLAVLAWQFDRLRARPEIALTPLLVGMIPRLALSVAFDDVNDEYARVLRIGALVLLSLAVPIVLWNLLRSGSARGTKPTEASSVADSSE